MRTPANRTEVRRELLLVGIAALLGVAGGLAAWVLVHLIAIITNVAVFHRWGTELPSYATLDPTFALVLVAMGGALVVSLLARWSPVIRGHGIPEAMEAILTRDSRIAPRTAIAKPASAAVAIGTGGPFGAEGPIIVTGGALGSLIGQAISVSATERKVLLACGAAAGMAATFGAPVAAVVLAIELLLFEFSTRALVPLIVASSIAGAMHIALFGDGPIFHVPSYSYDGLDRLPLYVLLGLACGVAGVVICKGLSLVEAGFERLRVSGFWHPVIGALGFGLIGLAVPRALGVGYDAIDDVLANRFAVGTLAVLLLAKLGAWWLALGSGTSGGTLAPILLIGSAFGSLIGAGLLAAFPDIGVAQGALALVAMAATFGAAARVPFTAFVFAFELTGDYHAILPLMLATVVADLVSRALLDHGLMTEKLARRGVLVPRGYHPDVLDHTPVRDAMTTPAIVVEIGTTVACARDLAIAHRHGAYPVVASTGALVGIVDRDGLLEADDAASLADLLTADPPTVGPDDTLDAVASRIVDSGIDHVTVTDDEARVVGVCTRADVLAAQTTRRAAEQRAPGRLPRWRRPRPAA